MLVNKENLLTKIDQKRITDTAYVYISADPLGIELLFGYSEKESDEIELVDTDHCDEATWQQLKDIAKQLSKLYGVELLEDDVR